MNPAPLALAYCLDNVNEAKALDEALAGPTGYRFDHLYCTPSDTGPALPEKLAGYQGKIILLLSDNFLRSAACLYKGLSLLENRAADVFPILIKGFEQEEPSGKLRSTETRIDKVSDIIFYINSWQDRYQQRRKDEREGRATGTGTAVPVDHLRVISSEIGEFLRLLRKRDPRRLEDIRAADFEPLFSFLQDPEAASAFRSASTREQVPDEPRPEGPEIDLTTIPGMDLLAPAEEEDTEVAREGPAGDPPLDWENPDTLWEAARHWCQAEEWDNAMELLDEAVDTHPNHIPLRYLYAFLLVNHAQRPAEAEEQLAELLRLDKDHADARFLYAEVAELQDDYESARERYRHLAEDFPDYPGVYYRLGLVLAHHFPEAADRAIALLQQATEAEPDNLDALYHYAAALAESENNDEKAKELLERVVEQDPDHPFAHYDLALIHFRQGATDAAREAYLSAVASNPDLRTPNNDRAFAVEEADDEETKKALPMEHEQERPADPTPLKEEAQPDLTAAPPLDRPLEPAGSSEGPNAPGTPREDDPLSALKQNIERLEEMMKSRQPRKEQPPKPDAEDRIVMITGATSGIGRATAHVFARNGFRLILTGRRQERLDRLAGIFNEQYGTPVKTLCYDVRDVESLKEAFAGQLDFEWRQIDILVNNAGKAKGLDPIQNGKLEHWEEMIDTNIKGLLYTTRAVLANMIKRRTGHIINVASTAGKEVYPKGNVYCATKFAVDALTKAMRIDLVDYNIRVGQVSPGHVEQTEFAAVRFDGDEEQAKKVYDNFVPLNAHDVADAIYYIATRPRHVNIQDILLMGAQQAGASKIDRAGRQKIESFIQRIKPLVPESDI